MRRKKISVIALVVCLSFIMVLAVGCGNDASGDSTSTEPETVNFTDSAGREVEVSAKITRIVPSGPMAQIVLFSLAPDLLVGLSGKWNPAAEQYLDTEYYNLPVLGQFYGGKGDLNLEEIAMLILKSLLTLVNRSPLLLRIWMALPSRWVYLRSISRLH